MSVRVLFICGDTREVKSTTEQLGRFLLQACVELNVSTSFAKLPNQFGPNGHLMELLAAIEQADVLVLAYPLIADSHPAVVVRLMEEMIKHRNRIRGKKLLIIASSSYPKASRTDISIAICHAFCDEMDYKWLGALAMGEEAVINGRSLTQHSRLTQPIITSLQLTAEALSKGHSVPWEAQKLMAKPMIPIKLYEHMVAWNYKHVANKNKVGKHIFAQPYAFDKNDLF